LLLLEMRRIWVFSISTIENVCTARTAFTKHLRIINFANAESERTKGSKMYNQSAEELENKLRIINHNVLEVSTIKATACMYTVNLEFKEADVVYFFAAKKLFFRGKYFRLGSMSDSK
jgi:hypothetical protein